MPEGGCSNQHAFIYILINPQDLKVAVISELKNADSPVLLPLLLVSVWRRVGEVLYDLAGPLHQLSFRCLAQESTQVTMYIDSLILNPNALYVVRNAVLQIKQIFYPSVIFRKIGKLECVVVEHIKEVHS